MISCDDSFPVLDEGSRPISLLIVERDSVDVLKILNVLEEAGLTVVHSAVAERQEFEAAFISLPFDAVLCAYSLPNWTGLDVLQCVRDRGSDIPVLLVTGVLTEDAASSFIQMGLDDYILKDRLARLPVALRRALEDKRLRTADRQIRNALAESQAKTRELIENSIYGIFRVSFEGAFLCANPALRELLACSSLEELCSLNLVTDVFRYSQDFIPLLASCRRHGMAHNAEVEWRRKDGGFVSVRLHLRLLSDQSFGEVLEGVAEDITEVRVLERRLSQAQKFESIGQLAAGIAHDFNNVLSAILGWAEIGYDDSAQVPAVAERFARIREQADRAAALTRELLTFARRQPIHSCPVDLNEINQSLASLFDKVIGEDIEIKFNPGILQPVKADSAQIEQVIMNLCLNARDAMPCGGRLLIETEMVDLDESYSRFYPYALPGRYAVLSVSDTGIGMDAETRDRIFEPFFTTKQPGRGTGMGLATVYGIVKQHGGFIHVYSEPGQGSLFRVYLPQMAEAVVGPQPVEQPSLVNPRGTETLLLAEDHDSIRELVRQSLVGLGYRVLSASEGEQALRLCDLEAPSLAILDLVMPRMGGLATAQRLLRKFPDLPIMFTSGYSESFGPALAEIPGARYLQKPYSPTALARLIREIFAASGQSAAVAKAPVAVGLLQSSL